MSRILVTGASGNVGRHIVTQLVESGATVRAAGHAPAAGCEPSTPGGATVDWTPFGFTDPNSWTPAFDGVDTMFLLRPPAISNVRRDLLPAVAAARQAGVRHVVFLSLQGAQRIPVVPHAKVETWLRSSGLGWTFVRPSFFTQNLSTTHAADIRDRDEILVPAGLGRTAFVDVADVAAVAATTLLHPAQHPALRPRREDRAAIANLFGCRALDGVRLPHCPTGDPAVVRSRPAAEHERSNSPISTDVTEPVHNGWGRHRVTYGVAAGIRWLYLSLRAPWRASRTAVACPTSR